MGHAILWRTEAADLSGVAGSSSALLIIESTLFFPIAYVACGSGYPEIRARSSPLVNSSITIFTFVLASSALFVFFLHLILVLLYWRTPPPPPSDERVWRSH